MKAVAALTMLLACAAARSKLNFSSSHRCSQHSHSVPAGGSSQLPRSALPAAQESVPNSVATTTSTSLRTIAVTAPTTGDIVAAADTVEHAPIVAEVPASGSTRQVQFGTENPIIGITAPSRPSTSSTAGSNTPSSEQQQQLRRKVSTLLSQEARTKLRLAALYSIGSTAQATADAGAGVGDIVSANAKGSGTGSVPVSARVESESVEAIRDLSFIARQPFCKFVYQDKHTVHGDG